MSTSNIAPVNAKINTIQAIEGAKGNIALFYYQGKYPIYKSLNDNMYHLKSVMDAYKASTSMDIKKLDVSHWMELKKTQELIDYFLKRGIPRSGVLSKKRQQNIQLQYLDGWYANEEAMLDFAGWLNVGFKVEIYHCFARQAEFDRLNADINHKQATIDELTIEVRNLVDINRKMCNQLETIKVTLSTLVENVSELKNHVTANKLCRYIIVLYKDEEQSDDKFIVIKPFCGLRENRPKIDKSDILFEREVSCSIDSFKEALSVLEERYIVKIHYRSMTIRRSNLEDFIDEFRVELRRRSTTITDVCDKLDTINDSISTVDSKVTSIDKRLMAYDKFIADYGADYAFVKRILDGEIMCKNNGKLYQLQISKQKQQPYINMNGNRLYMPLSIFAKRYL